MEKSKVLIQFLVIFRQFGDVLSYLYARTLRGYTATDVFRDWPFLGFSSCVSLVTAANFRLFLNVAIFLRLKCYAVMKTELFCIY